MNILLISQCSKRALKETRRILDQFAERRGDRTWQTPITESGLLTLRKLLRKTARKNTAVACHWIRGKDHSELLWIVGSAQRFNVEGAVPTNTTARNVLRLGDENDWHTGRDISLLAQLAGLLHDLGKASVAFQERLHGKRSERNLYRHEWVSLRLFQAFVGADDDPGWLARLADAEHMDESVWTAQDRYQRDGIDADDAYPFRHLPPLAAAVGWLVVTHHRLPVVPVFNTENDAQCWLGKRSQDWKSSWLDDPLPQISHAWNEIRQPVMVSQATPYWQPDDFLPVIEPAWRKRAARLARQLMERRRHHDENWLNNPYVMHLARLALMLADHHYSSLPPDSPLRVKGGGRTKLFANTDAGNQLKQPLDEHLLGVSDGAGKVVHALPGFEQHLPRLAKHRGLRKRSADRRFAWQDKAWDAAFALRERAREQGAFIVNMASTGCGKTLANARITYALADPQQGMRATYALGLRSLTLQTGSSYRRDLRLDEDELAVHVGGSASRGLFEFYREAAEEHGSASQQSLIEEDSHVLYEGNTTDHPLLQRALTDPNICKLLSAPVLVCTVDHLTPATESLRAGRQIAPMLRLMSADLILDELDDYGLDDMPALTRLVYWAGLLGTRVVLSSATLPPALVTGMYLAYGAGRKQFERNRGSHRDNPVSPTPCVWVDEFGTQTATCSDGKHFNAEHANFVERRVAHLQQNESPQRGAILPLSLESGQPEALPEAFAQQVHHACLRLHADHAHPDPVSGKRVSFGLVRMANIDPLFDVAQFLFKQDAPHDTHIHLCVYHARFPLVQRSAIENLLDAAFHRKGDPDAVFQVPAIRAALDKYPERNHLFVVLASPVCEVGRDWDADWAIVEPSSLRSIIQLAGRVQRHRRERVDKPNILIFDTNLKHFKPGKKPHLAFQRPGFEDASRECFQLSSHWLHDLLHEDEYQRISALPRIQSRPKGQPRALLADLEHARTQSSMLPRGSKPMACLERDCAYPGWRYTKAALTGVLPQQQPFREQIFQTQTLAFLPDEDEDTLRLHRVEKTEKRHQPDLYVRIDQNQRHDVSLAYGDRVSAWYQRDLMDLLIEQVEHLDLPLRAVAARMATVEVPMDENESGWRHHPLLGFAKA